MACYHPWLGVRDWDESPDVHYKLVCGWSPDIAKLHPGSVRIPCGKCIGCRLDYSRTWADRMMLELESSKKGIFVTLTYNNNHVPFTEDEYTGEFGVLSLDKRDVQLFFKRLRKRYPDKEIRYYLSGEYGTNTKRPHYHAIIFGLGLDDFPKKVPLKKNELGQLLYTDQILQDVWSIRKYRLVPVIGKRGKSLKRMEKEWYYDPIGFVSFSEVSWKTCAYVARYVMKKVGLVSDPIFDEFSAVPEFSLMSRRPGLGAYYLDDHPDLFDNSNIYVRCNPDPISVPKFFLFKLKLTDPDRYDKIIAQRKEFAQDALLLKLQKTELSYIEQLEVEENHKLAVTKALKRL